MSESLVAAVLCARRLGCISEDEATAALGSEEMAREIECGLNRPLEATERMVQA